ncbi:MAG: hypothetical protein KatS3mg028_0674 [Bacteroidia bacterium]|nr:MAG: hypothetical protein KatS3mg028_0674 [Bacteroidia bacterium]
MWGHLYLFDCVSILVDDLEAVEKMTGNHKNILIGITGGIAAYKIPFLVRLLVQNKFNVKVIMTDAAQKFVTPETISVLSKRCCLYLIF